MVSSRPQVCSASDFDILKVLKLLPVGDRYCSWRVSGGDSKASKFPPSPESAVQDDRLQFGILITAVASLLMS